MKNQKENKEREGEKKACGGVKFESEVEFRTFGKNDEPPRRMVGGREDVWKWMEGDEWGLGAR